MICCKIITNYDDPKIRFSDLCDNLSNCGSILWINHTMYFGSLDEKTSKKTIIRYLKKAGSEEHYIEEYNVNHLPQEDNYINGWVYDYVVQITKLSFENTSQESLKQLSSKLIDFNKELDDELEKAKKFSKMEE